MKDLSVEDLISEIWNRKNYDKASAELLRRFESLEKELKAVKIAHAVAEDIMHTNFNLCKSSAEHWKMMVKDLMCCGNCKSFDNGWCKARQLPFLALSYCGIWQSDSLSREEREGK